mmetsp:Transcript_8935/g.26483  ORF Transcript_8935/g.26483 Transcript_8935/m.26483 type:complete len:212 (-) Transcript_8935:112-747(-)
MMYTGSVPAAAKAPQLAQDEDVEALLSADASSAEGPTTRGGTSVWSRVGILRALTLTTVLALVVCALAVSVWPTAAQRAPMMEERPSRSTVDARAASDAVAVDSHIVTVGSASQADSGNLVMLDEKKAVGEALVLLDRPQEANTPEVDTQALVTLDSLPPSEAENVITVQEAKPVPEAARSIVMLDQVITKPLVALSEQQEGHGPQALVMV